MGVVYRARDGAGQVALKVLAALADTEELRRALVEARAGSRLEHPGIARLLEAGRDAQGRHWIALELVAGETLQARLTREGPLPLAEALRVARDLALRALAAVALGEREAALADRVRVHRLAPGSPTATLLDEQLRAAGIR